MALNQRLKAHVNLGKGVIRKVGVCVTEFEPGHRMVWTGGMPFGLFTGRRTFTLEAQDSGLVEFKMHLHFSGLCAGPISRSLGDRQPDIDAFAAGLKKYAER